MISIKQQFVTDLLINVEVCTNNYSVEKMLKNKFLLMKVSWMVVLLLFKIVFSPYKQDNRNGRF